MRCGLVGSLTLWLLSGSIASAQGPALDPVPSGNNPPSVPSAVPDPASSLANGTFPSPTNTAEFFSVMNQPFSTHSMFWARVEYLLWFMKPYESIPLVQQVPSAAVALGSFNGSQAITLFPAERLSDQGFSGTRANVGFWFDPSQWVGLDLTYWRLMESSQGYAAASTGLPGSAAIGRPIIDTNNPNIVTILLLSNPNPPGSSGAVAVSTTASMEGADANTRFRGNSFFSEYFDWLVGFKYVGLHESIFINDRTTNFLTTQTLTSFDSFRINNRFYGGQIGGHAHYRAERFTADILVKLALGGMVSTADRDGATTSIYPFAAPVTQVGGTLVQRTNIGSESITKTVFIPEVTFNLGYQLTDHIQIFAGYNFMYITSVVRASGTVDPFVNSQLIPFVGTVSPTGFLRPLPVMQTDTFWVQGFNFGLSFTF